MKLLLIKLTPHMILQTHPITKMAVTNWSKAAKTQTTNAVFQWSRPYSVLQPHKIARDDSKVPCFLSFKQEEKSINKWTTTTSKRKTHMSIDFESKFLIKFFFFFLFLFLFAIKKSLNEATLNLELGACWDWKLKNENHDNCNFQFEPLVNQEFKSNWPEFVF